MELPPFNDVADLFQEVLREGCEAVCHVWREGRLDGAAHQSLLPQVVERSGKHLLGDLGDGAEEVAKADSLSWGG